MLLGSLHVVSIHSHISGTSSIHSPDDYDYHHSHHSDSHHHSHITLSHHRSRSIQKSLLIIAATNSDETIGINGIIFLDNINSFCLLFD